MQINNYEIAFLLEEEAPIIGFQIGDFYLKHVDKIYWTKAPYLNTTYRLRLELIQAIASW